MSEAEATSARTVEILLIEDNQADIDLTLDALKSSQMSSRVSVARDGNEALDFLRRLGPFHDSPRPELIVLDLNLPRKNGFQVLSEIKADPALYQIPVVILTTSDKQRDVAEAYTRHANCFITKPFEFEDYVQTVRELDSFWLSVVTLPP